LGRQNQNSKLRAKKNSKNMITFGFLRR